MSKNSNIAQLFFSAAQKYPQKTAIVYKNKEITFGSLADQVQYTVAYFLNKGILKGDRVLIFVPMSIDLYRIVLALFSIGATAVFLDEWVNKKRMEECCKVAECNAFIGIFKARLLSWLSPELRKIPVKLGTKYKGPLSYQNKKFSLDGGGEATALITFTTGSTGIPKGAKRTHYFLFKQFDALNDKMAPKESDIDMPVLPIVLFMNLGNGTTSIISDFKSNRPERINARGIIEQLLYYKVNRIIASPFFVKKISEYIINNNIQLPEMKKIFTGGAPVFPNEARIYMEAFPDVDVEVVYGSTEAEPVSSIDIKELLDENVPVFKNGLRVGSVYRKAQVKIIRISDFNISVRSEDNLESMPIGTIGEIIVCGDHVLTEYVNNEEAIKRNKIFIKNKCWHRTGDSGYLDGSGKLYLTGRCNTIIEQRGVLVAPFLYENYFQSIRGVNIGTVLSSGGEIVCVIELNDMRKMESVREAIGLLEIKFDKIIFVKKIPRDLRHHSKIDYYLLLRMLN